jgi:hypothetical protein
MSSTKDRAWAALTVRLRENLPADAVNTFVGGTHTRRFADNLLSGLSQNQISTIRTQLGAGAGGELTPTATGRTRAHAPYSSAALAANAFGRWLGAEQQLQLAGLHDFDQQLSLEHKLQIAHHGGVANLDCVLQGPELLVGVESKLTETLEPHQPVRWKTPYRSVQMSSLLDGGWSNALLASLSGDWAPQHLGLEQLIKHALALNSHKQDRAAHLVYVYWEPTNASELPEVAAHRDELSRLVALIETATPRLHTLTYRDLLTEWSTLPQPDWIQSHVAELRQRYELPI